MYIILKGAKLIRSVIYSDMTAVNIFIQIFFAKYNILI